MQNQCKEGSFEESFQPLQDPLSVARDTATNSYEELEKIFNSVMKSHNQIKSGSNTDIASIIVSSFDIFQVLEDFISNNQRRTRQSASKPLQTQQCISDINDLGKRLDKQIIKMFRDLGENDPILKGIALTPAQMSLTFKKQLLQFPNIRAFRE